MPNKDKPLVDRHAPKDGVGWLVNDTQGKVCRFKNDMPSAHAEWVEVETRLIRGGGQPVVRRLLRHNAISAWETMQKSGGWKRCRNQAGGSDARLSGEDVTDASGCAVVLVIQIIANARKRLTSSSPQA